MARKKNDYDEEKGAGDFDWAELLPKTFPVALTKLNPYENNPRINEKAIPFVKRSIKRFGFIVPIVVDNEKSLTIAAGHTRLVAALQLCEEQSKDPNDVNVMCLSAEHLTPSLVRQFRLADNRVASFSEDDAEKLKNELFALADDWDAFAFGFDADDFGFGESEEVYTTKIPSPEYKITGECPKVADLYDNGKAKELFAKIESAKGVSGEVKEFLKYAAFRHCKIDYAKVAEFYAHASKKVQELFEDNALVIIDYDKAIENGFVKLCEKIENEL